MSASATHAPANMLASQRSPSRPQTSILPRWSSCSCASCHLPPNSSPRFLCLGVLLVHSYNGYVQATAYLLSAGMAWAPAHWPAMAPQAAVGVVAATTTVAACCLLLEAQSTSLMLSAACHVIYHSVSELTLAITDGQLALALQPAADSAPTRAVALAGNFDGIVASSEPRGVGMGHNRCDRSCRAACHLLGSCSDGGGSRYMPVFSFSSVLAMSLQNLVQLCVGPRGASCSLPTVFRVLSGLLAAVAGCCGLVAVVTGGSVAWCARRS